MKNIIRQARKDKGWTMKTLAQHLAIDQALISKYEKGLRIPTKEQIRNIAEVLEIDQETLLIAWMKERILNEYATEPYVLQALVAAEDEVKYRSKQDKRTISRNLEEILEQIDQLRTHLNTYRKYDSFRIAQALELEYTYESNRIEGNTLTLRETDLVINEGLTVSGKSMKEHLEAINHQEAIVYIKELMDKKTTITQKVVLNIHNLILRGIYPEEAGKYRSIQVMIKGSTHMPPQPYLVAKQMEELFFWYHEHRRQLHPVLLAAEMHERLVTIHPFIDGNGRTSRLLMNLILLQHGYVIANIKGDYDNRMAYYQSLEMAQTQQQKEDFLIFIAANEQKSLERYLSIIQQDQ
ncbi:DNA-binding protein [Taibaiella sp. KBW10]|uniref:Fic family protein n=1 Tax=Taibaiella sp. KBW10 TaxID=2153357 RepID=UPI000F59A1DC|nr:Fic family protein [Taibaiella sp. KBW10]RQO31385.1 DNA-binding protein [Taibaiella sp. KBW10]